MTNSERKTVVVTGGSRGLGFAIVKRLASANFRVITVSRKSNPDLLSFVRENGHVHPYYFDLANTNEIGEFVKNVAKDHGRIYGLVNNAALGFDGVLATMHDSQIRNLIDVNVLSTILFTKYCVRSMLLLGQGRVINISSIIASTGFNGLSVYAASKAALGGFTRSLARELGKAKITVNTVAPGYMETEMTGGLTGDKLESIKRRSPLGKLATVEDVAAAVHYLIGEEAAAVTGSTLTVDAGSTA
jgi:3-oxoacyl-[acyl-carrier protein] reductase